MSKSKTLNVWDLLSDREAFTNASDAVVNRATESKTVEALRKESVANVKEALKEATDPESFAQVVSNVRAMYGSHTDLQRTADLTRAAVKISAAVRREVIRAAFTGGHVGTGKTYPTQGALAAAVGCSGAYVSQNKPTPKDADKVKAGTASAESKGGTSNTPADDSVVPTDLPTDLASLQQALTRLENASRKVVGTPENADDIRRIANALDMISRSLRSVADVKPAENVG